MWDWIDLEQALLWYKQIFAYIKVTIWLFILQTSHVFLHQLLAYYYFCLFFVQCVSSVFAALVLALCSSITYCLWTLNVQHLFPNAINHDFSCFCVERCFFFIWINLTPVASLCLCVVYNRDVLKLQMKSRVRWSSWRATCFRCLLCFAFKGRPLCAFCPSADVFRRCHSLSNVAKWVY